MKEKFANALSSISSAEIKQLFMQYFDYARNRKELYNVLNTVLNAGLTFDVVSNNGLDTEIGLYKILTNKILILNTLANEAIKNGEFKKQLFKTFTHEICHAYDLLEKSTNPDYFLEKMYSIAKLTGTLSRAVNCLTLGGTLNETALAEISKTVRPDPGHSGSLSSSPISPDLLNKLNFINKTLGYFPASDGSKWRQATPSSDQTIVVVRKEYNPTHPVLNVLESIAKNLDPGNVKNSYGHSQFESCQRKLSTSAVCFEEFAIGQLRRKNEPIAAYEACARWIEATEFRGLPQITDLKNLCPVPPEDPISPEKPSATTNINANFLISFCRTLLNEVFQRSALPSWVKYWLRPIMDAALLYVMGSTLEESAKLTAALMALDYGAKKLGLNGNLFSIGFVLSIRDTDKVISCLSTVCGFFAARGVTKIYDEVMENRRSAATSTPARQ